MPCLAHTLQLTLKAAVKHRMLIHSSRARKLVFAVRRSSVANEALIKKSGKTLVRGCCTRWNSTFDMWKRLLEIRSELNSTWGPGHGHTSHKRLGKAAWALCQSLSQVVPCLLNLEAHFDYYCVDGWYLTTILNTHLKIMHKLLRTVRAWHSLPPLESANLPPPTLSCILCAHQPLHLNSTPSTPVKDLARQQQVVRLLLSDRASLFSHACPPSLTPAWTRVSLDVFSRLDFFFARTPFPAVFPCTSK